MKKHLKDSIRALQSIWIVVLPIGLVNFYCSLPPSNAQTSGVFERPQEREMYNTLPGSAQKGTILDATNPMELMNRLRRASAMDNATAPSDAIDQALRALEVDQEKTFSQQIFTD